MITASVRGGFLFLKGEKMDKEKYIFECALQNKRLMQDVVNCRSIDVKYLGILNSVLSADSNQLPNRASLKEVYGVEIDSNDWDMSMAYHFLEEINTTKRNEELATLYTLGSNDVEEDELKIKRRYSVSSGKPEDTIEITDEKSIRDAIININKQKDCYLKTNYKQLGLAISGSMDYCWRPGDLYCVMGLSGYGKSIFLCSFAVDSLRSGYRVLYLSTEMDCADIITRIFKHYYDVVDISEIPVRKIIDVPALSIIKVNPSSANANDIQAMIDNARNKPDVVIIDYADELLPTRKMQNDYDGQGVVYSDLKALAHNNGIPILTATQTNRTAESEKGGTKEYIGYGAISDSLKKVRLVDVLFSIIQSKEDKEKNKIAVRVLKNRHNASNGLIRFNINYQKMKISEMGDFEENDDEIIKNIKEDKYNV